MDCSFPATYSVIHKLECGRSVSKEKVQSLISTVKGTTSLVSLVTKASMKIGWPRTGTYFGWYIYSYLKELCFTTDDHILSSLRCAPVCKEPEYVAAYSDTLFGSQTASLEATASKGEREKM